jgi:hypothetical protein
LLAQFDKYTYFLLAAAGAAIALALNQTQGSAVPLAAAVLCWGLSFFFGVRHIKYVNSTLYANAELLTVESGEHRDVGNHPQLMAAASEGTREAINHNAKRANSLGCLQFAFLIAGAVFLYHLACFRACWVKVRLRVVLYAFSYEKALKEVRIWLALM